MNRLVKVLMAVAVVLLCIVIAPALIGEKGYVLVSMGRYTIEMTVISLGFLVLMTGFLLVVLLMAFGVGRRTWFKIRNLLSGRASRAQTRLFYDGLYALACGDTQGAKTIFQKIKKDRFFGFNYIALGQLALQNHEHDDAKKWFDKALSHDDGRCSRAASVLKAQHHLFHGEPQQALDCLDTLDANNDSLVMKLKADAWVRLKNWHALSDNLPKWKKPLGDHYLPLQQRLCESQFADIASKQGAIALKEHWQTLSRSDRNDMAKRFAYVNELLRQGMHQDVQTVVNEWYAKTLIPDELVGTMKQLRLSKPNDVVKLLERAIKKHPEDAKNYAALGHIAYYANDLALAEKALAKAITLEETAQELSLLADLYEQQQAYPQAIEAMRRVSAIQRH